jgi:hypothetical protein
MRVHTLVAEQFRYRNSYMNDILWQLPVPVTGIIRGPHFKVLPKRRCEISFSIEGEDGGEKGLSLLFEGVEAYKSTYLTSLDSIDQSIRTEAYGKLISIKNGRWLEEVKQSYVNYQKGMSTMPVDLRHFVICFDDGPFFEVICHSFREKDQ